MQQWGYESCNHNIGGILMKCNRHWSFIYFWLKFVIQSKIEKLDSPIHISLKVNGFFWLWNNSVFCSVCSSYFIWGFITLRKTRCCQSFWDSSRRWFLEWFIRKPGFGVDCPTVAILITKPCPILGEWHFWRANCSQRKRLNHMNCLNWGRFALPGNFPC